MLAALPEGDEYGLFALLHESAARFAPVDSFYVCLYDPVQQLLRFDYNRDGDIYDDPVTVPLGNGPTSQVVRTGQPFVLQPTTETTQRGNIGFGDTERLSRSAVHVPLLGAATGEQEMLIHPVRGVMSAQSYEEGVYDAAFVAVMEILAEAAGERLDHWRRAQASRLQETELAQQGEAGRTQLARASRQYVADLFALGKEIEALRPLLPPGDSTLRRAVDALSRSCHRRQTEAHRATAGAPLLPEEGEDVLPAVRPAVQPMDNPLDRLTARESDIALLIGRGFSNPAIAAHLCITLNTVKYHIRSVLTKLEATNRTEIARIVAPFLPPNA